MDGPVQEASEEATAREADDRIQAPSNGYHNALRN
jgi:hypothetical protein